MKRHREEYPPGAPLCRAALVTALLDGRAIMMLVAKLLVEILVMSLDGPMPKCEEASNRQQEEELVHPMDAAPQLLEHLDLRRRGRVQ